MPAPRYQRHCATASRSRPQPTMPKAATRPVHTPLQQGTAPARPTPAVAVLVKLQRGPWRPERARHQPRTPAPSSAHRLFASLGAAHSMISRAPQLANAAPSCLQMACQTVRTSCATKPGYPAKYREVQSQGASESRATRQQQGPCREPAPRWRAQAPWREGDPPQDLARAGFGSGGEASQGMSMAAKDDCPALPQKTARTLPLRQAPLAGATGLRVTQTTTASRFAEDRKEKCKYVLSCRHTLPTK